MPDVILETTGNAGLITLNRPAAMNALTWDMCLAIETALDHWRHDASVKLVIIQSMGVRAFCAGGDIADIYASGQTGDLDYARRFWRDEYRLNSKIAQYPKPVVTFLQGFTMGGGVGLGCHASHRIVCETSQIALPECTIGLIPDVGSTYLLARSPGYIGNYLGLTGARMDTGDALYAGFADHFVPYAAWDDLRKTLIASGIVDSIPTHAAPHAKLRDERQTIDQAYCGMTLPQVLAAANDPNLSRNSPLAMAAAIILINEARASQSVDAALKREYCFTHRAVEHSDFIEGIRAAIIDKDKSPRWRPYSKSTVQSMLSPLGPEALILTGEVT